MSTVAAGCGNPASPDLCGGRNHRPYRDLGPAITSLHSQPMLRRAPGKNCLRVKRRRAAWDDSYLASVIAVG